MLEALPYLAHVGWTPVHSTDVLRVADQKHWLSLGLVNLRTLGFSTWTIEYVSQHIYIIILICILAHIPSVVRVDHETAVLWRSKVLKTKRLF